MSPSYLNRFPQPLLDELHSGRWLPIVGAGLSRNAVVSPGQRVPLWDELGRSLAEEVPGLPYLGAIDALSAFEQAYGRRALVRRLGQALLIDDAIQGAAHESFCRLPFRRVITTNFDFLLERAYVSLGRACDVVVEEEQLTLPVAPRRTVLLKLHGDLRHPERLVVSENDFDGFLTRYPVLATHVASLLIEQVPVLIGYSLEDPDLRQLLALLRDRLGRMMPNPYAIMVGADANVVERYQRRGIKVIALPGSPERYGDVLAQAFSELGDYWRAHALDAAEFTEDRPLEEIETAEGRGDSRLCYFAVPRSRIALYRDEIFPLAEEVGLVPTSGFDVEVGEGNLFAATGALIGESRLAVVDMSEQTGSVELGAALQLLGPDRVLVIAGRRAAVVSVAPQVTFVTAPSTPEESERFVHALMSWFEAHRPPEPPLGLEIQQLVDQKQWRAAFIAAMADLEALLGATYQHPENQRSARGRGRARPPLRRILSDRSLPIDDALRARLLEAVALRNVVLHEGVLVTRTEAEQFLADLEQLKNFLSRPR
jgi:hypothetical protein